MRSKAIFKAILFLLTILVNTELSAQSIGEPCARILVGLGQDSITWQATPCANFGGYIVFGKESAGAVFIALDTIFDPLETNFAQNNPAESLWFYQIGMICNGVVSLTTIVVDNQRPVTPDLRSVSIIGGQPVLTWDASPSPEVVGYQIYKEIPYGSGNYFPHQFVLGATTFTDTNTVNLQVRYMIVAVSPCNEGPLGEGTANDGTTGPHSSMIASGNLEACSQTYTLNWNAYQNWEFGIEHYEIWVSTNGQAAVPIDTVDGGTTSYVYTNLQDGDNLVIYIRAAELGKVNYAVSNELAVAAVVNRPMDFIRLTNVSVNAANQIDIDWQWDTDVDFASGELKRGNDLGSLTAITNFSNAATASNSQTDANASPQSGRVYYQINTIDACAGQKISNYGSSIYLEAEAEENFRNALSWTRADMQYAQVDEYRVYKIVDNNESLVATVSAADSTYQDQLDVTIDAEANSCYYIMAVGYFDFPAGPSVFFQSRSNQVCVPQNAVVYMPNALAPYGENPKFRPVLVFGRSVTSYSMQIFNRYGGQVFQTTDIYESWDGTKNGEELPQGVYVYNLRLTQPNGEIYEQRGTVMLLY